MDDNNSNNNNKTNLTNNVMFFNRVSYFLICYNIIVFQL